MELEKFHSHPKVSKIFDLLNKFFNFENILKTKLKGEIFQSSKLEWKRSR